MLTRRAVIHKTFLDAPQIYSYPLLFTELPEDIKLELAAHPASIEIAENAQQVSGWWSAERAATQNYRDLSADYLKLSKSDTAVFRYSDRRARHAVFLPINTHHNEFYATFGDYWFHHLARFLFRPGMKIQSKVDGYVARAAGHFLVGVHIRTHHGSPMFLAHRKRTKLFWRAVRELVSKAGVREYRVFLATDDERVRAEAFLEFGSRLLFCDFSPAPDGDSFDAAVDQNILCQCDALVVTDRSSFSYFAHAYGGIAPLVVEGLTGTIHPQPHSQAGTYDGERVLRDWPWLLPGGFESKLVHKMAWFGYRRIGTRFRILRSLFWLLQHLFAYYPTLRKLRPQKTRRL